MARQWKFCRVFVACSGKCCFREASDGLPPAIARNRHCCVVGFFLLRIMRAKVAMTRGRQADQAVFPSDCVGGCSPGLLAQRSRFSMTLAWLGRRGGGDFRSSDSLRGSFMFSVMRSPPSPKYTPAQMVNQPLTHCF